MEMSWDNILRVGQLLALVGSVAVNIVLFLKARNTAFVESVAQADRLLNERLDREEKARGIAVSALEREHSDRQAEIDRRLSVVETRIQQMPTHKDLDAIESTLTGIGRQVAALEERSSATLSSVQRVERYLLERPR